MTQLYLFGRTLSDLLRPKRSIVWMLLAVVIYGLAMVFLGVSPRMEKVQAYSILSGILVFRILPLASAIFAASVISQEVEQKTIVYLLTRPIHRWQLISLRTLAAAISVMILTTAAALAVSFASYGAQALSNEYLYRDLKGIIAGSLAYVSLFVLVSLLVNKSMVVNLIYAFAWEIIIPNMPGSMYTLSISSYLTAVTERPTFADDGPLSVLAGTTGNVALTPAQAWPVIIGVVAFCAVLGAWWFSHFEFVPREDAE